MRTSYVDAWTPSPKERALRGAILAVPILCVPIPPAAVFGVRVVWVVFAVLASLPGAFVVLFYGFWSVGWLTDGAGSRARLLGDDTLDPSPPYWPWGSYQRRVRRARHIHALEEANCIPYDQRWHRL